MLDLPSFRLEGAQVKRKQCSSCDAQARVPALIACVFLACACVLSCSSNNAVVVKMSDVSIEKRIYDENNRPDDKVSSHPSVEANTHWDFEFIPEIGFERTSLKEHGNEFVSVVLVKKVEITLALPIQIWLPASATEKVIAHEGGHVEICRHFYSSAEKCARAAAETIVNREFSGCGATESESMRIAVESAGAALATPYRNSVILPANRASSIYDELTKHGQADTPVNVAVKEAIEQAMRVPLKSERKLLSAKQKWKLADTRKLIQRHQ